MFYYHFMWREGGQNYRCLCSMKIAVFMYLTEVLGSKRIVFQYLIFYFSSIICSKLIYKRTILELICCVWRWVKSPDSNLVFWSFFLFWVVYFHWSLVPFPSRVSFAFIGVPLNCMSPKSPLLIVLG